MKQSTNQEMPSLEGKHPGRDGGARRPRIDPGTAFIPTSAPYVRHPSRRAQKSHQPVSPRHNFRKQFQTSRPPSSTSTHTMTLQEGLTTLPFSIPIPVTIPDLSALEWTVASTDLQLTAIILLIVPVWLSLWQKLTESKVVTSITTRKAIHITCGPAFLALWPLYTNTATARLLACSVPTLFIVVLLTTGLSKPTDRTSGLGRAISRRGNARDVLQGPLYYTLVLLCTTAFLFQNAVAGIAIMQLCFGDGMAEIFGRKFGKGFSWPFAWASHKTLVGSFAFALAGFVSSCAIVDWYSRFGLCEISLAVPFNLLALAVISIVCAAVELAPLSIVGDDNVAIAVAAVLLSTILL